MKRTAFLVAKEQYGLIENPLFTPDILAHSSLQHFEAKEYIHRQGDEMTDLFYVVSGSAKILKTEANGKRTLIQFLAPHDFIGELGFIEAEVSKEETKDVQARTKVVCLSIPMSYAKAVLFNDPRFLQKIGQYIGQKLITRMAHFSVNQNFELRDRLAEFLLEHTVAGYIVEKQAEIAEYLGVSYRHLAHTFKEFREYAILEKTTSGYRVDQKRLEEYLLSRKGGY